jgi:hypothetical protein
MEVRDTDHLKFHIHTPRGRKTPIVTIISRRNSENLGEVKWHGAWRQFCLYPNENTIWSVDCINDITSLIKKLVAERLINAPDEGPFLSHGE